MKSNFLGFHLFPLSDWRQLGPRLSGNNARHILAVIEHQENDEELTDFLGKILSAAKINLGQDALLLKVTKGENISFSNLSQSMPARHVLLFGAEPRQLGLHFALPLNQPVKVGGACFLLAHPLGALFEEREAESRPAAAALWKNLKQLFLDSDTLS